jgi:hypothetical protein
VRTVRGGACSRARPSRSTRSRGRDPDYPLERCSTPRAAAARPASSSRGRRPAGRLPEALPAGLAPLLERDAAGRPGGRPPRLVRRPRAPGAIAEEARRSGEPGLRHHYLRSDPSRLAAELRARACATTRASAGRRSRACARARRTRTGSGIRSGASRRLGAAARGDGRDALGGALPRARRRRCVRGRGRGARAGREHGGAVAILWHPPQHHPRSRTASTASTGACSPGSTSAAAGPAPPPRRSTAGRLVAPSRRASASSGPALDRLRDRALLRRESPSGSRISGTGRCGSPAAGRR